MHDKQLRTTGRHALGHKPLQSLRLSFLMGLVGLLSGCTSQVTSSGLLGTYQSNVDYGTATLILKSSGTYDQTFTYSSGRVVKHTGTWNFDASNNNLELYQVLRIGENLGPPDYGLHLEDGWSLPVSALAGRITMEFNPDLGWGFRKIK